MGVRTAPRRPRPALRRCGRQAEATAIGLTAVHKRGEDGRGTSLTLAASSLHLPQSGAPTSCTAKTPPPSSSRLSSAASTRGTHDGSLRL